RSGQLRGKAQRRRRGIGGVKRMRIDDVEIPQRERRVRSELRPDGDGPAAQLEVAHVDLPLERTPAGLRRLARLDRALQGGFPRTGDLRDLDPGSLELRLGDDHPVRLQGQRLQPYAGAVGAEAGASGPAAAGSPVVRFLPHKHPGASGTRAETVAAQTGVKFPAEPQNASPNVTWKANRDSGMHPAVSPGQKTETRVGTVMT